MEEHAHQPFFNHMRKTLWESEIKNCVEFFQHPNIMIISIFPNCIIPKRIYATCSKCVTNIQNSFVVWPNNGHFIIQKLKLNENNANYLKLLFPSLVNSSNIAEKYTVHIEWIKLTKIHVRWRTTCTFLSYFEFFL